MVQVSHCCENRSDVGLLFFCVTCIASHVAATLSGEQVYVIGDVINHGKREFWGVPNMHYHQGFKAGENTLNTLCTRSAAIQ